MHTSITVHGRATSVCALTRLPIQTLAPTHSIHSLPPNTEFGRMVKMRSGFELFKNSLSSTIPWQLGFTLDQMTRSFLLYSNKLCDDVPDAVSSYSNSFYSGWQVVTGNSIGTICGWESYMDDYRFPTMGSTSTTSIDYSHQNLTGTIPTQASRFSAHCHHLLNDASSFSQRGLIRCTMIPPSLPRLSSSGC